jgi:hypothetical protein
MRLPAVAPVEAICSRLATDLMMSMHHSSTRARAAFAALLLSGIFPSPAIAANAPRAERRCGWYENPTPGNVTLTDRDGTWLIAMQGNYEAKGHWPEFSDAQWVVTNSGEHGYGCACLTVQTDPSSHTVLSISHAAARPLAVCRRDKSLHEPPHDPDIDE